MLKLLTPDLRYIYVVSDLQLLCITFLILTHLDYIN